MTDITISFIIPTLNAERYLKRCLDAIRGQMVAGDELIVVDNGSSDQTVEISRSSGVKNVQIHPGLTVAALRNVGVAASTGTVLAFIDSDCILLGGWREAVIATMSSDKVVACGSMPEVPKDATWVERAWGSLKYRQRREVHYIPSMNFVVWRSAFQDVHGFEAELVSDEDTDLCHRLISHGGVIVENPHIAVVHLGYAKTLESFCASERWHASSIMATMSRNGIDRPMVMTFAFMAGSVVSIVLLAAAVVGKAAFLPVLLPILLVPFITVLFRTWQYRTFTQGPTLMVLYTLFYFIRSSVVMKRLFARSTKQQ